MCSWFDYVPIRGDQFIFNRVRVNINLCSEVNDVVCILRLVHGLEILEWVKQATNSHIDKQGGIARTNNVSENRRI